MTDTLLKKSLLLHLPPEIRAQILEEAIAIRRPAPSSPSQSQHRRLFRNRHDTAYPERTDIYIEDHDHAKSAQFALLATCRQIRDETQKAVTRVSNEPYRVDVMFVYKHGLFPTWLSLPCLQRNVPDLHVHLRIFDSADPEPPRRGPSDPGCLPGEMDEPLQTQWSLKVFLTVYLLRACRAPDPFDARGVPSAYLSRDIVDESDEDGVRPPVRDLWEGEEERDAEPWSTARRIVIDVDEVEEPMLLWPGDVGERYPFGHSVFLRLDTWPHDVAPPRGIPNPRFGPAYKLASSISGYFEQPRAGHRYVQLMVYRMRKIDVRVAGREFRSLDTWKMFWHFYGHRF